MFSAIAILAAAFSVSSAIVCPPNACDGVKQPLLNCKGGVLKNAGFCGCTDICAKVEGEPCSVSFLLGVPNLERCDDGLMCTHVRLEGMDQGHKCMKTTEVIQGQQQEEPLAVSRRDVPHCKTACQKKSALCTTSFVIYSGQWFAKCDTFGNFLSQQCDNTGRCFCVDNLTGEIQEGSKVLGAAKC